MNNQTHNVAFFPRARALLVPLCITKVKKASRIQDSLPIYGRTCRVTAITFQTMIKARMKSHARDR